MVPMTVAGLGEEDCVMTMKYAPRIVEENRNSFQELQQTKMPGIVNCIQDAKLDEHTRKLVRQK